jgi:hypothetical protein
MRTVKKLCIVILLLLAAITSPAYSNQNDPDQLFRTVDLMKLLGTDTPVNLQAQMKNPDAKTHNINDLDSFIAIGVIVPTYHTMIVEFDQDQNIMHSSYVDSPWVGVAYYHQSEIPALSLQQGLTAVQACMAKSGTTTPDDITRVVIYKTLNTSEIIYDYVFKDDSLPKKSCQEFLYSPSTDRCQKGMVTNCHFDIAK